MAGFNDQIRRIKYPIWELCQAGATTEGIIPDASDTVRDWDARQDLAVPEGTFPDTGDGIGNRDARQAGAIYEGVIPDAGDGIAFDSRRYD